MVETKIWASWTPYGWSPEEIEALKVRLIRRHLEREFAIIDKDRKYIWGSAICFQCGRKYLAGRDMLLRNYNYPESTICERCWKRSSNGRTMTDEELNESMRRFMQMV